NIDLGARVRRNHVGASPAMYDADINRGAVARTGLGTEGEHQPGQLLDRADARQGVRTGVCGPAGHLDVEHADAFAGRLQRSRLAGLEDPDARSATRLRFAHSAPRAAAGVLI